MVLASKKPLRPGKGRGDPDRLQARVLGAGSGLGIDERAGARTLGVWVRHSASRSAQLSEWGDLLLPTILTRGTEERREVEILILATHLDLVEPPDLGRGQGNLLDPARG
ncbi:hypothetical protein [Ornithinimicrobium avium]|uniref:hypothetical protein n=1 Tax=Ornithinimicrobium avium TaxID=2283195 RepID=UPI0013B44705|nr:hypothetical protein [Ornithinimicrobium avium]